MSDPKIGVEVKDHRFVFKTLKYFLPLISRVLTPVGKPSSPPRRSVGSSPTATPSRARTPSRSARRSSRATSSRPPRTLVPSLRLLPRSPLTLLQRASSTTLRSSTASDHRPSPALSRSPAPLRRIGRFARPFSLTPSPSLLFILSDGQAPELGSSLPRPC